MPRLDEPVPALPLQARTLRIKHEQLEAHFKRGNALCILKRFAEALESFEQVLQGQPDHVGAHCNRGFAFNELQRFSEALHSYDRALALDPHACETHYNRGNVLRKLMRLAPALASYDAALQIKPEHAEAHANRGSALLELNRLTEALESFDEALRLRPDHAEAQWNESLCRLLMGDFARGWQQHEWRWRTAKGIRKSRVFAQARWLGNEDLKDKTILLYAEQGFGDTIQFCRYVRDVAALGATVLLEVPASLQAVMRALEGVAMLFCHGEALPEFDYQCPLLSLPLAFQADSSTISNASYLQCSLEKCAEWKLKLNKKHARSVGLAWSGNPQHINDAKRSIPLAQWLSILDIQGNQQIDYYCLQTEVHLADQNTLEHNRRIRFFGSEQIDFSDTAALIELMDLVITVDTSIAHLAGAMGKEVWILLPFNPDWRWQLDRTDSPWYGSARLFRQQTMGDWDGVLAQVAAALTATSNMPMPPAMTPVSSEPASMARLKRAFTMHQQGQWHQAKVLYQELLQSEPRHFDALQLLATLTLQEHDAAAALLLFDRALAINPHQAELHNNRGIALSDLNRPQEALQCYDQALLLGPEFLDAHNNRGNTLRKLRQFTAALESHGRALALKPDHASSHNSRGNTLHEMGQLTQALQSYDKAILFDPEFLDAHNNQGNTLFSLQQFSKALDSYEQALILKPEHAPSHNNRGNALHGLKRYAQALRSYKQAILLAPDFADAHNNCGIVLSDLQLPAQALESYEQVLRINPEHVEAHKNCGNALCVLKRFSEALQSFEKALSIAPDFANAHWNESLCRLSIGDFARGWQKYEWRWKTGQFIDAARNFTQALWLGQEALQGKTILLHAEQGLGDTLQFCRYATQVAALGACVILEVQAPLLPLMRDLAGVAVLLGRGDTLPHFDYQCPLLSLPLAFQSDLSTISHDSNASNFGYLHSTLEKRAEWYARLNQNRHLRVGLAWSGNPEHKSDANRSIALAQMQAGLHLSDSLTNPGQGMDQLSADIDYYCLQKELLAADQLVLQQTPAIRFFGNDLIDFSDTAALIAFMDLVITVDTGVAHLAGAMAKEVWILLPFHADWRWLQKRTDSPWYPSARLFRQSAIGDWDSVLAQVAVALQQRGLISHHMQ